MIVKICSFFIIGIIAIIISLNTCGVTVAFDVNYGGSIIATVKSATSFERAKSLAMEKVSGDGIENVIVKPEFTATLAVSDRLDDEDTIAQAIIENTNEIIKGAAVTVNGVKVACVESGDLSAYLDECLAKYNITGAKNISSFIDNVNVVTGYYLSSEIESLEKAKAVIDNLPVKTVSVIVTNTDIAYNTVKEKSDTLLIGSTAVATEGKNGLMRSVESVITINGVETQRQDAPDVVVSNPTDEVILVGTAKTLASAEQKIAANEAGFIFPLPKSSWNISAFYGDGRSHKGVDLSAKNGTAIYAVQDGTVSYSGFDGNYGYCVIIDHGDGIKTRYAHASQLNVKAGEKVIQGETIALVGCTGDSTGNHLHFEVLKNGGNVDPAPYIGID